MDTRNTKHILREDFNMSARFFICDHCGNLVTMLRDAGAPMLCCGEKMRELIPNTVEASGEKHLPVAARRQPTAVQKGKADFLSAADLLWLFVIGAFLGDMVETVFWDYSKFKFNLGGRINLLYCFFWGIAAAMRPTVSWKCSLTSISTTPAWSIFTPTPKK